MKVYFVTAFRWFLGISLHVCVVLAGLVVEAEAAFYPILWIRGNHFRGHRSIAPDLYLAGNGK